MKVIKRDGSVVDYDYLKVQTAIEKCFAAIGNTDNYADVMTYTLGIKIKQLGVEELAVEEIQDMVEKHLMEHDEYDAAKAYILYRNEKTKQRDANTVPPKVKAAFDRSAKYFESPLQQFQFFDKYSRFDYGKGRRETWEETVARSVQFLREISDYKLNESEYQEIFDGVLEMKVMPSMRLLAMAGDAAKRNNISLYNCSYVPVDNIQSFVEALTISMCGCGVGFSVESQYVNKLPIVKETIHDLDVETWLVEDSATGWADALDIALKMFWSGNDIKFDLSLLRPAGAILKTKGGRSSGPTVLRDMLNSIKKIIRNRAGKYIRPIDAHDIMCIVGEAAVQGGTRRTAMISLFDFDDKEMLKRVT
jgi:ribonucleoside-diphosphate reductase alpha chain